MEVRCTHIAGWKTLSHCLVGNEVPPGVYLSVFRHGVRVNVGSASDTDTIRCKGLTTEQCIAIGQLSESTFCKHLMAGRDYLEFDGRSSPVNVVYRCGVNGIHVRRIGLAGWWQELNNNSNVPDLVWAKMCMDWNLSEGARQVQERSRHG